MKFVEFVDQIKGIDYVYLINLDEVLFINYEDKKNEGDKYLAIYYKNDNNVIEIWGSKAYSIYQKLKNYLVKE